MTDKNDKSGWTQRQRTKLEVTHLSAAACGPHVPCYKVVAVVPNLELWERPRPLPSQSPLLWAPVTAVSSRHPANKFLLA